MLCWTRQPVKTCTEPLSMRTGKCTVSSRFTSRRPRRTSSERSITSAAASKRRWAVWKAETRVSTAMCGFRYYSRRLRVDGVKDNCGMTRNRILGIAGVAAVALATGFLLAGQVKAQLLTPSNQVARYQALVRSVQDLEKANESSRAKIAALRAEIDALEASAAQQSASTKDLQNQVADLRAHAGLTAVHGPGVEIDIGNGPPAPDQGGGIGYLVNYQDVQDLVNLVFASGAEGVSVSGRRITPLTAFSGSAGQVIIDQGPPLSSPITILAVGDRNRMAAALEDASALPDIRARQVQFQLHLTYEGSADLSLPAYDSSLQITHVSPL